MGFEKHRKSRGRGSAGSGPRISIRSSNSIGINTMAVEEYFEDVEYAAVYYDPDSNQVGIEPSSEDDPDAYSLQHVSDGRSLSLNAAGFLKQNDITVEQTTHFEPTWDDEEGLVIIDLDEPVGTYGSPDEE